MDGYALGKLFGRLVASYALVWLCMWLAPPRNGRVALRRTHRWYGMLGVYVVFFIGLLLPLYTAAGAERERVPRPMHIHRVAELGLEIWTEADPEWETQLTSRHGQPIFTAETPALTYPPGGMSWVSVRSIELAPSELEEAARGAIHQAAHNYGLHDAAALTIAPASYGEMSGFESRFSATAQGTPVDVLIFFGHRLGRPAVLAHAYTAGGKLDHISENIRRSWTNLRYLE